MLVTALATAVFGETSRCCVESSGMNYTSSCISTCTSTVVRGWPIFEREKNSIVLDISTRSRVNIKKENKQSSLRNSSTVKLFLVNPTEDRHFLSFSNWPRFCTTYGTRSQYRSRILGL